MLSLQEVESVAALKYETGFIILLDAIQAQIDTLADELSNVQSGTDEAHMLGRWRALRLVYGLLKGTPEEFAMRVDEDRAIATLNAGVTMSSLAPGVRLPMPPEALEAVRSEYNRRMKK